MTRILAFALCALSATAPAFAQTRQQQVEQRGAHVMPFSMSATMHMFTPTPDGGTMEIVVHSGDPQQIALVRSHLRYEAAQFARGNYADPAYIHGKHMPGLKQLAAGAKRVTVRYVETDDGAAIVFQTSDKSLAAALHDWFKAQVHDHGHDAMMM